ncbi:MAG: hypothetical protein Q9170_002073 [Blastenia crenularia]
MVDKLVELVMTDSSMWTKHKQEPAPFRNWSLPLGPLRSPSPCKVELPPSPALSSHSLDRNDLELPPKVEALPGDDKTGEKPGIEQPGETGYPSPVSDHRVEEDVSRAPVLDVSKQATQQVICEQIEPDKPWTEKNEMTIIRPFEYLMAKPGKSFRRQLLTALNFWAEVDEESLGIISRVVEMIDDIQDQSKLRRGSPAAHLVFGTAQTINAANYVYFLSLRELTGLRDPLTAMQIFNEEVLNLHRGQGLDLFWRETLTAPSEEEYLQMVDLKTGGLFRLAARLLQSASSRSCNLVPLVEVAGLIFQIRDDYENLCSKHVSRSLLDRLTMTSAKGYCDDLTEGKFSFPVVHSIRNSPNGNNELLNILKQHTDDVRLKGQAVWYMQTETDSFEYTKGKLRALHADARARLANAGPYNELFEQVLMKLAVV